MKYMQNTKAWISYFLTAAMLAGGCSGDFVETTTNQYANYKEATEGGALQRGWLPRNLPGSAHGIIETHNIDTNELWAKFQFIQSDINSFLRQCIEIADLPLPSSTRAKKMAAWWPETLTDKSDGRLPSAMQTYHCSSMPHANNVFDANIILDAREQIAWYWIDP